ncbi:MAG: hypothetical protein KDM63_19965, partial [Verrucomicrobiae bacterium]|nr:hypothetical protein [Verrucomicrobiae bacterium]
MSDSQKILFSILGAVVGHLLLFLLLGLLFAVSSLLAPQAGIAAIPAVPAPEEVTILLSDLMEQVELKPKELTQRYMRTDPDQESAVKPKDAPFHSDRNTVLTSERPPDPSSDLEAPTVTSDVNLPVLEIRDRQFVDGDFLDQSATSAPSSAAQAAMPSPTAAQPTLSLNEVTAPKPTPIRDPSEQETEKKLETDATPRPDPKEAPKASPQRPADADTPPDRAAETETQPDSLTITDTSVMARRQESFETPFAAEPVAKAKETNESDREAESRKETV